MSLYQQLTIMTVLTNFIAAFLAKRRSLATWASQVPGIPFSPCCPFSPGGPCLPGDPFSPLITKQEELNLS